MKKHSILAGFGLAMLALSAQAQDVAPSLPVVNKARSTDAITTYRIGSQGVSANALNQVLRQTGYPDLPGQFTVLGYSIEGSRLDKRWTMVSQFDIGLGGAQTLTNGVNTVRASFYQYGVGVGYHILRTDRFTLTPKLMISPTFFKLKITQNNAPAPSLTAALVNPGSQQTASFNTSTFTGDLGLSGQYRFVYKETTQQTDCGDNQIRQRSLVVGFDAGYRLSSRGRFDQFGNDQTMSQSDNPTVNLSGWYVTARLGFGTRYIR